MQKRDYKELIGERFTRLTVLLVSRVKGNPFATCLCDCGKHKKIYINSLQSGATRSCGCLQKEHVKSRVSENKKMFPKEYNSWSSMKQRCMYKKSHKYPRYGGRGIVICDRWVDSFDKFINDMGPKPSDKHTIDRIDNDGNYEPSNCRWITNKEQSINRGNTILVDIDGKKMTLIEVMEIKKWTYSKAYSEFVTKKGK